MLDVAYAYRRYGFIGEEFLTWLWFVVDNRFELLEEVDPEIEALEIGKRMVLQNRRAEGGMETLTIKGDNPDLEEALLAIRKGAMVSEVHLVYRKGDGNWEFTLKGESLDISGLKAPETAQATSPEELEGAVIERIGLYDAVIVLVERLFGRFIQLRIHSDWEGVEMPAIRKWLEKRP
jgi:hypothetical protein